ncbi:uncharacterized protein HMPREF1541_02935 [Cyphellophora europaea CBS 101466]|uniref:Major facilitator superfamily (MFS) profile domain-containing protein n=1 Tax=Cyphellophora europaea (strain CBS 101466) TaxID=1220924 RepID=W2RZ08_CYPE1|nr:uncharacterized protein HMPREF1541_02935 [Cyphellophora europaea CBS 101466]ETN41003.1 hypothetical protein HMPREF1541_02935 [Cyphellophora europaea CBS 101466]
MLKTLRGRSLYRLMKIVSGLSFCMYGYDAGVLGGMLLHPPFQEAMGNPKSVWIYPMIIASYDLAAFATSIVIASFTMKIGRRGTAVMGNAVAVLGAVVQASAYGVPQMIVGRLLTGFAIGSISCSIPTYLNECGSKIHDRGPANALNAMFLIGGVPLAYWVDYGFVHWYTQASWRIPVVLQCCFAIPADTPRWYYARGRIAEGDAALSRLYDQDLDADSVQATKRSIMTAIEIETEANETIRWYQFLGMGFVDHTRLRIIRRLVMCFWLPMLGEWMGISLLAYFTPVILQNIGLSSNLISVLSGVVTTTFFLGTIPLYWTVERFGRRGTMLYSAIASTILYIIFIGMVGKGGDTESWVAIGLLFFICPIMTYGWQANKFLYSSEISPLEYRHIGGAFFASGEWLMVFITVFACPIGFQTVGWTFWFLILAGNICAVVFVYFLCPETAGRTLEQIDYLFIDSGLPGLRRNSLADIEEAERKMSASHVETARSIAETKG